VFANFKTNQVSLDGKTVCCSILSGSTPSGERTPEPGSKQAAVKPTVASKGGQQPQPTPIRPTEDSTESAIRGLTAATTPTPAPAPAGLACCAIMGLDAKGGTVSARATATGQAFSFAVTDRRLFDSLKVGQPVYANFKTGQVSLDGKKACCAILAAPPAAAAKSATAPSPLLAEYKVLRQRALGLRPLIHASNALQAETAKADWTVFLRDLKSWASRYQVKLVWHSVTPPNLPPLDCPDISSVGSGPGDESEGPPDPSQAGMDTTPNDFGNGGACYLQQKSYAAQRGWICEYVCVPSDLPTWGGSPSKE
jgi:hypothetical protein